MAEEGLLKSCLEVSLRPVSFAGVQLVQGSNHLVFRVVGKDADSDGILMGVDSVSFQSDRN